MAGLRPGAGEKVQAESREEREYSSGEGGQIQRESQGEEKGNDGEEVHSLVLACGKDDNILLEWNMKHFRQSASSTLGKIPYLLNLKDIQIDHLYNVNVRIILTVRGDP